MPGKRGANGSETPQPWATGLGTKAVESDPDGLFSFSTSPLWVRARNKFGLDDGAGRIFRGEDRVWRRDGAV